MNLSPMMAHAVLVYILYALLGLRRRIAVKAGKIRQSQFRENYAADEPAESLVVRNNLATELLMERGGWPNRQRLCYQSKVGASKWLQPSLHKTIRNLATENVGEVCVVPIAFVSDHVETLGEIDHEAREEAAELGIKQFEMTAGLNDSPTFIAALADLVENALGLGQCVSDRLVAAD